FPQITFSDGYNVAVVSPGSGGGVVGVPELSVLRAVTKHLGGRWLHAALNPPLQRITAWGAALLLGAEHEGDRIYLRAAILEVQLAGALVVALLGPAVVSAEDTHCDVRRGGEELTTGIVNGAKMTYTALLFQCPGAGVSAAIVQATLDATPRRWEGLPMKYAI